MENQEEIIVDSCAQDANLALLPDQTILIHHPCYSYLDAEGHEVVRSRLAHAKMITYVGLKRIFDTTASALALLVLSPLMLIIAIAIKLDSKGPVFFKQVRTGKNGKEFTLYKFRSMSVDNDVRDTTKKDQVTRVGKIIRKTSLDELPQLWNVVKQDMAIIGPRPWIPEYYKNMNAKQRRRNDVRPGLTGLAQCSGRNNLTIFDKIHYDLEYIEKYSLKQDIKVIYLTIKSVFCGIGIGDGGQVIQREIVTLKKYNKRNEYINKKD